MQPQLQNTTLQFYPKGSAGKRLFALWFFTCLMIVWNILGHTFLGFEQPWASPIVAIGTAVVMQLLLEWVDARARHRPVRFLGSGANFVNSLPPALIPGFACGMLIYSNERMLPLVFAVVLSIASKVLIRAPVGQGRTQHVFNPSNFGVAATLVLFASSVGFAPPYHFTQNLDGIWHWIVPGFILCTGIVVHAFGTGRLPLVLAWVIGFMGQGLIRVHHMNAAVTDPSYLIPWQVPLMPMTSAAFVVFTLYMVPDPATTPIHPLRQILFGLAVAAVYGVLQEMKIVFGLFFALVAVCAVRGASLWIYAGWRRWLAAGAPSAEFEKQEARPAAV